MDKMSLGERLRSLREARDIGVRELGRLTGINHATLSQAENGKRWVGKLPSYEDLSALARVFGITVDELVDPHVADARASFLTEPVGALLDRLRAEPTGDEIEFDMTASAGTGKKQPKSNRIKVRKPHYLIEVEGDCMVPEIESGDTVRFDPTLDPEDGDWVVATVDGERAIVKKLVIKGRTIALGKRARLELGRWWARFRFGRGLDESPTSALFITENDKTSTLRALELLLLRLGRRAGVTPIYPHRFRHTFAILALRAGMDPFVLMTTLGHKDMAMTKRYLNIVNSDVRDLKRANSPLDALKF